MQIVAIFDPTVTTSDTFILPSTAACGKIVVYNESNISLQFTFQNGFTSYVPAWTAIVLAGTFGTVNVTWQQQKVLAQTNPPISQVVIEVYDQSEDVPGQYPTALVRAVNQGTTNVNLATSVANDGNVAGTVYVESTVTGDSSSASSLTNDGHLVLGNITHNGLFVFTGAIGNVNILASGELDVAFLMKCNLIRTISGNDLTLDVETGHKIAFQINHTDVVKITSAAMELLAGVGSILVCQAVNATTGTDFQFNVGTGHKWTYLVNNVQSTLIDSTGIAVNNIRSNAGANLILNASTGDSVTFQVNGVEQGHINVSGASLDAGNLTTDGSGNISKSGGKWGVAASGDIIDASTATDIFIKTRSAATDVMEFQVPGGTTIMKITGSNNASTLGVASTLSLGGDLKLGTTNGGLNNNLYFPDGSKVASYHGISGSSGVATNHSCPKQPTYYTATPDLTGGVTTINVGAISATQITVSTGNGGTWRGFATTFN